MRLSTVEVLLSNRQRQMILDSAGVGIVALDQAGQLIFVNPAAATMLRWKAEELVGLPLYETLYRWEGDGTDCRWEESPVYRTLRKGRASHVDNETFWRKDGTNLPVEYTSTPIREEGRIFGAVMNFQDITQRRIIEIQLRQAQKLESIGQLAAGIAHQINTPTQYIGDNVRFLQAAFQDLDLLLGKLDRLLQAMKKNAVTETLVAEFETTVEKVDLKYLMEEMPKAIQQSLKGVGRVASVVRSMKEFSHPGGQQQQAVDLNRAIENTLTVSRNRWSRVANVVTELDPGLPPVNCLPNDCSQVILNLVINAADAIAEKLGDGSAEKGTITASTRRDGEWVEIRIADTGTGISEAVRPRIFDPFFTTKEVGKGTGQGLAIAHFVVTEKHGGTIRFQTEAGSDNKQRGTTFIIRLPICRKTSSARGVQVEKADSVSR